MSLINRSLFLCVLPRSIKIKLRCSKLILIFLYVNSRLAIIPCSQNRQSQQEGKNQQIADQQVVVSEIVLRNIFFIDCAVQPLFFQN